MSYDVNFYEGYLEKLKKFEKEPWVRNYIELKKKPNFWTILEYGESVKKEVKKSSYEIRMSRMIRWLLDANENHNLGNLFAYEFLKLIDDKFQYTYSSQKNHLIKAINEALKDIDIFYKDLDSNVCVAIEFKQYSKEIIYEDDTSQLDKYQKAVEDFIGENEEAITPFYIYLTPKKDTPSVEGWKAVGYADIIKILEKINNEHLSVSEDIYKDDIQKIILDFKDDLQRTIDFIDKANNATTIRENYSEEERKFTTLLANEITHELDSSHIDELIKIADGDIEEMIEMILLLADCVKIQKQDRTPNDAVRQLIRKVYMMLSQNGIVNTDLDKTYSKKQRLSNIKHEVIEKNDLKVSKLLLTQGKGQGIYLLNTDESRAIYFSGDKGGIIPNDGMQLLKYNEKNEKGRRPLIAQSEIIIPKNFRVEYDKYKEDTLVIIDENTETKLSFADFMENHLLAGIKELNAKL